MLTQKAAKAAFFKSFKLLIILFTLFLLAFGAAWKLETEKDNSQQKANILVAQSNTELLLQEEVKRLVLDINFLSSLPTIFHTPERTHKKNVEQVFQNYQSLDPQIDQVRILNLKGDEVIRIERKQGEVVVIDKAQLQNKQSRYYFQDAVRLDQGVAFSKLDLNREHGKVEQPHKPVIRLSKPIHDKHQRKIGVMVINFLAAPLLEKIKGFAEENDLEMWLASSENEWLIAPKTSVPWAAQTSLLDKHSVSHLIPDFNQLKTLNSATTSFNGPNTTPCLVSIKKLNPLPNIVNKQTITNRLDNLFLIARIQPQPTFIAFLQQNSNYRQLSIILTLIIFSVLALYTSIIYRQIKANLNATFQEELINSYLKTSPDNLIISDTDGKIIFENHTLHELQEALQSHIEAQPFFTKVGRKALLNELIHNKTTDQKEIEINLELSGHAIFLYIQAFKFTSIALDNQYLGCSITDITHIKHTEKALKEAQDHARSLMDAAPDAITLSDESGLIVMSNKQAHRIFGKTEKQLMFQPIANLFLEDDKARIEQDYQDFIENKQPLETFNTEQVVHVLSVENSPIAVEINLSRLTLGNAPYVISVIRDIDSRLELEETLRQTQKMDAIGKLTSNIVHDFNNSLGGIIGNLELASRFIKNEPEKASIKIDQALTSALKTTLLTKKLLSFSRKNHHMNQACNLTQLISDQLPILETTLGSKIGLNFNIADEVKDLQVEIDSIEFESSLINLVLNARDAIEETGRVDIGLYKTDLFEGKSDKNKLLLPVHHKDYLALSVVDTGSGIPPENLQKIFQPFFTTKSSGKGTGLGLASIKRFIEQSGGNISVVSQTGLTAITLFFPILAKQTTATKAPKNSDKETAASKILILDDDSSTLKIISTLLISEGYQIEPSDTIADAKQKIQQQGFDLLVSDVLLPDGTGVDLVKFAIQQQPSIKAVFISGYQNLSEDDQRYISQHPFFSKPLDVGSFLTKISELAKAESA